MLLTIVQHYNVDHTSRYVRGQRDVRGNGARPRSSEHRRWLSFDRLKLAFQCLLRTNVMRSSAHAAVYSFRHHKWACTHGRDGCVKLCNEDTIHQIITIHQIMQ